MTRFLETARQDGLARRLSRLAKLDTGGATIVSVYLDTRWSDERQRDRVRIFLKNEIRAARARPGGAELTPDLDWIEEQGTLLVDQQTFPEARGVALFASRALGLYEIFPLAMPFRPRFVVANAIYLTPLAAALEAVAGSLVVFVDGESARLITIGPEGADDAVLLQGTVPGRHRQGGWALLAESHYQRRIQQQRGRHFEAVAEAIARLAESTPIDRIVLAGDSRNASAFRGHLPPALAARVVGPVPGARHESDAILVARVMRRLGQLQDEATATELSDVLTAAAKGGQAVVGLDDTLEAMARGAVHCLYLANGFHVAGGACVTCGTLQPDAARCLHCGADTRPLELGTAMVDGVLAKGGHVEVIERHPGLEAAGGVAARLRYAL